MRRATGRLALCCGLVAMSSCGSGESILDAGREGSGETVASFDPTATAPPTTATPLATLPPCPVDALQSAEQSGDQVEVLFWYALTGETEEALKDVVQEFHRRQDRVRVRIENQGGYNESIDKYRQSSQGDRPDMVMLPEYMLREMADSDTVVPAGACIEASGFDTEPFIDRTLAAYSASGVQWAMPFNVSNPILYYNKNLFAQAGLDRDKPPTTLAELRRYSQQIADRTDAVGIGLESGPDSGGGWFIEQWLAKDKALFADSNNGRAAPATQVLYGSRNKRAVEFLTLVQQMVEDGGAINLGNNSDGFDQLLAMADRASPTAMAIASTAALGTVKNLVDSGTIPGATLEDLGVGPMPGPAKYRGALVGGASLYLMAEKDAAVTAGAWEFIQFATTAESQSAWSARSGYAPIREDATEIDPLRSLYEEDPRFKVAYDQLSVPTDDPATNGPVLGPMREIRSVNARMTEAILAGADVATQLDSAVEDANKLIRQYNATHVGN